MHAPSTELNDQSSWRIIAEGSVDTMVVDAGLVAR